MSSFIYRNSCPHNDPVKKGAYRSMSVDVGSMQQPTHKTMLDTPTPSNLFSRNLLFDGDPRQLGNIDSTGLGIDCANLNLTSIIIDMHHPFITPPQISPLVDPYLSSRYAGDKYSSGGLVCFFYTTMYAY